MGFVVIFEWYIRREVEETANLAIQNTLWEMRRVSGLADRTDDVTMMMTVKLGGKVFKIETRDVIPAEQLASKNIVIFYLLNQRVEHWRR